MLIRLWMGGMHLEIYHTQLVLRSCDMMLGSPGAWFPCSLHSHRRCTLQPSVPVCIPADGSVKLVKNCWYQESIYKRDLWQLPRNTMNEEGRVGWRGQTRGGEAGKVDCGREENKCECNYINSDETQLEQREVNNQCMGR